MINKIFTTNIEMTQIVQVKQVVNVNAGKTGGKKKKKTKRGGGGGGSRRVGPQGLRGAVSMYDPTTKQPIFVRVDNMREIPTSYWPIPPTDLIRGRRLESDNQQIRKNNIQMVREQQIQNGYFQNLANMQIGGPSVVQPAQAPLNIGPVTFDKQEMKSPGTDSKRPVDLKSFFKPSMGASTSGTARTTVPNEIGTGGRLQRRKEKMDKFAEDNLNRLQESLDKNPLGKNYKFS